MNDDRDLWDPAPSNDRSALGCAWVAVLSVLSWVVIGVVIFFLWRAAE